MDKSYYKYDQIKAFSREIRLSTLLKCTQMVETLMVNLMFEYKNKRISKFEYLAKLMVLKELQEELKKLSLDNQKTEIRGLAIDRFI